MDQSSRKLTGFVVTITALLILVAACNAFPTLRKPTATPIPSSTPVPTQTPTPYYISVDKVWERAEELDRQRITIRGRLDYTLAITLLGCEPDYCGCNERWVDRVTLTEESSSPGDLEQQSVILDYVLYCKGDQCSIRCYPFNPHAATNFEFFGTLVAFWRGKKIDYLTLQHIDIEESKQQTADGKWIPIETGGFTLQFDEP